MTEGMAGGVCIVVAVMSLAASLVCLVGGERDLRSVTVGIGFALLAACFAWLWAL